MTTVVQSADALTKTASADVDGDGDIDQVTVDQTVINADGSRVRTVTVANTDGSVRSLVKETLGADKVTATTWVDQIQDGVFQATDLVQQVTVNATTQARTETTWARNPDGTVKSSSVTAQNGTSVANSLTGTAGQDLINGLSGNDTIAGGDGSDSLIGGTGADILWGGAVNVASAVNGSDTYVWAKGDGNDTINDWGQPLQETDTLELINVTSSDVTLTAASTDLLVNITPTGEVLRIDERFQNVGFGYASVASKA